MSRDEARYAAVMAELANGDRRVGLWAKALTEAVGEERVAQSLYVKWRVAQLRKEAGATAILKFVVGVAAGTASIVVGGLLFFNLLLFIDRIPVLEGFFLGLKGSRKLAETVLGVIACGVPSFTLFAWWEWRGGRWPAVLGIVAVWFGGLATIAFTFASAD